MVKYLKFPKGILIVLGVAYMTPSFGQSGHKNLMTGDKYYADNEFYLAEEQYRKARAEEKEIKSAFNLGTAVYMQERYEEAVDHFEAAFQLAPNDSKRADALFNKANALFQSQKFADAIASYKEVLVIDDGYDEARYNLMVCKEILKRAKKEDKSECNNPQPSDDPNQEKNEEDKEKNEDQQQQDQQQQEQENQEQQKEQQEQEEKQDSTQQESSPQDSLDQEPEVDSTMTASFDSSRLDKQTLDSLDAMKLLQIIKNEEQKIQERLKKFNSNRKKSDKDW